MQYIIFKIFVVFLSTKLSNQKSISNSISATKSEITATPYSEIFSSKILWNTDTTVVNNSLYTEKLVSAIKPTTTELTSRAANTLTAKNVALAGGQSTTATAPVQVKGETTKSTSTKVASTLITTKENDVEEVGTILDKNDNYTVSVVSTSSNENAGQLSSNNVISTTSTDKSTNFQDTNTEANVQTATEIQSTFTNDFFPDRFLISSSVSKPTSPTSISSTTSTETTILTQEELATTKSMFFELAHTSGRWKQEEISTTLSISTTILTKEVTASVKQTTPASKHRHRKPPGVPSNDVQSHVTNFQFPTTKPSTLSTHSTTVKDYLTPSTPPFTAESSITTTKSASATIKVEIFGNTDMGKYGYGRTIGFLSIMIFFILLTFCCFRRYRKRREYGKLRQLEEFYDDDDYFASDKKKRGKYQSDRLRLLDGSSEDELL